MKKDLPAIQKAYDLAKELLVRVSKFGGTRARPLERRTSDGGRGGVDSVLCATNAEF